MKRMAKVFYNLACIMGCVVGIIHFFAPYWFEWFSYIPDAPIEIYQSINYINFCFSFLLVGMSLILIIVQRKMFSEVKELKLFYVFYVLVWLSRIIIQLIWPWPSGLQLWLVVGFTVEFIFTLVPVFFFTHKSNTIR